MTREDVLEHARDINHLLRFESRMVEDLVANDAAQRQTIEQLEARIAGLEGALKPFASGGDWGAWKAWLVEGAPTRGEGIAAARTITRWQCVVDEMQARAAMAGERREERETNP